MNKCSKLLDDRLFLYAKEVAQMFRISPGTLANWRTQGRGPKWTEHEGRPVYPTAMLKEYFEQCGFFK